MEQNKKKYIKSDDTNEAGTIASFYGYTNINAPEISKRDITLTKNFSNIPLIKEKSAITHLYFEEKMMATPQPIMLYCEHPFLGLQEKKKTSKLECSLFTLGSSKSVVECLSIETAISILNKLGYKDLVINLNSIGDKESISEFNRKLNSFIKKNINNFPAELRQAVKKNIYSVFKYDNKNSCIYTDCPKSIDFLSEQSRIHFKEVLEFLEIMNIPYIINHNLLGDQNIGTEIIFDIREKDEILANGIRFDKLTKKIGYRKDLPSAVLHISAKTKKILKRSKIKKKIAKFYLIQFGQEAKLKSFLVLRQLYKANVGVMHSIVKDKLGSQVSFAEDSGATHIILIGQKEAIENSVVIRNITSRSQEVVPINEIGNRVKQILSESVK